MAKYPEPIAVSEQKEILLDRIRTAESNAIKLAEALGKDQYPRNSIPFGEGLMYGEINSMMRNTDTLLKL